MIIALIKGLFLLAGGWLAMSHADRLRRRGVTATGRVLRTFTFQGRPWQAVGFEHAGRTYEVDGPKTGEVGAAAAVVCDPADPQVALPAGRDASGLVGLGLFALGLFFVVLAIATGARHH